MIGIVIAFFVGIIVAATANSWIDHANRMARYKEDKERIAYDRVSKLRDRIDELEATLQDHAAVCTSQRSRIEVLEIALRDWERAILATDTKKENRNG